MPVETTVSPWLIVRDGPAAIEFYKAAFGAVEWHRVPDGGVAQLAIDGSPFWITDESERLGRVAASEQAGRSHWVLLTVEDPDDMLARAIRAGATPDTEMTEGHGWRSATIIDPDGHQWTIGKPIVAWPPT